MERPHPASDTCSEEIQWKESMLKNCVGCPSGSLSWWSWTAAGWTLMSASSFPKPTATWPMTWAPTQTTTSVWEHSAGHRSHRGLNSVRLSTGETVRHKLAWGWVDHGWTTHRRVFWFDPSNWPGYNLMNTLIIDDCWLEKINAQMLIFPASSGGDGNGSWNTAAVVLVYILAVCKETSSVLFYHKTTE